MYLRATPKLAVTLSFLAAAAAGLPAREAHAADIVDGKLVFAKDALATYSFESFDDVSKAGGETVKWTNVMGYEEALTSALAPGDESEMLVLDGLEGKRGLRIRHGAPSLGLALRDDALFTANADKRISVTMWGRSYGAEPVLQLIFTNHENAVATELVNLTAIRTGRETSDGWVEYATGPIDGTALGVAHGLPLKAILLTARYATAQGQNALVDYALDPNSEPYNPVDVPGGYAVIDAVEVRREPGAVREPTACTLATIETACDPDQDCMFGRCVDSALVWGPVPEARDHRADLAARWGFVAESLQADRQSIARAATVFAKVDALASVTSPRGYFGKLNAMVADVHDSHTQMGVAPGYDNALYPIAYTWSGPMDLCFGVTEDDIGGTGRGYSVFERGPKAISASIEKGDLITAIDDMPADDWIALAISRMDTQTPDPAAMPSHVAFRLGELIGRYASTLSLTRCTTDAGCSALPVIHVGDVIFAKVLANEWPGGFSSSCSSRFKPSVQHPPDDDLTIDPVVVETDAGVTSIQFDGFVSNIDTSMSNPYASWETPMTQAFVGDAKVLVDARVGFGGYFDLGKWLFQYLRGTTQPYGMFSVPRGTIEDPDPSWLLTSMFDACPENPTTIDYACGWAGYNTSFTSSAAPPGEASKIAWVNGNDVSMNDIVPRLLQGRANFRVFGPHPTHGSYGEVSQVAPILPAWGNGSIQVLDMRFGTTPDDARTHGWESGHGVVPDEVVVQKVSDILNDRDTVIEAAKAWLLQ